MNIRQKILQHVFDQDINPIVKIHIKHYEYYWDTFWEKHIVFDNKLKITYKFGEKRMIEFVIKNTPSKIKK